MSKMTSEMDRLVDEMLPEDSTDAPKMKNISQEEADNIAKKQSREAEPEDRQSKTTETRRLSGQRAASIREQRPVEVRTVNRAFAAGVTPPSRPLQLPSHGVLYDGRLPGGTVEIVNLTGREEKLVAGASGNINDLIDMLLRRIMINQEISPSELLLTDRIFILFHARANSYGPRYDWKMTCRGCNKLIPVSINIPGDLSVFDLDEDAKEPFTCYLPISGDKVEFRLLRGRDEAAVLDYTDQQTKNNVSGGNFGDPSYDYRLALHIQYVTPGTIDHDALMSKANELFRLGKISNPDDVEEALDHPAALKAAWRSDKPSIDFSGVDKGTQEEKMSYVSDLIGRDSAYLRSSVDDADCGFKLTTDITCPNCRNIHPDEGIPLTAEFFRPSRRVARNHT